MIKNGFTLIELMVVVAILATLTVVLVPQFNNFKKTQDLADAASELQTVLRLAQSNAVSSVNCNNGDRAKNWEVGFTGGSGVNSYQLKATCQFTVEALTPTPTPVSVKQYILPSRIKFGAIGVDGCLEDLKDKNPLIAFENISGRVDFMYNGSECASGNLRSSTKMQITLEDSGTLDSAQVVIEKGGSVYVSSSILTPVPTP